MFKAFNDVVEELTVTRANQLVTEGRLSAEQLRAMPPEWWLNLGDFNVICDVYHCGLTFFEFMRSDEFKSMFEEALKNPIQVKIGLQSVPAEDEK